MYTLHSSLVQELIRSSNGLGTLLNTVTDNSSIEIEGIQGGLRGFFIAELIEHRRLAVLHAMQYKQEFAAANALDVLVVVSNEKDAEELLIDFSGIYPQDDKNQSTVEIIMLPWWGTVPYRSAPKSSLVFGQRAAALARLSETGRVLSKNTRPRLFIVTQRAFQTPVPSPEYIRSLLFTVRKGQQFDPVELAKQLATQGYTRVPRVALRGEFALRGEVLDIYMPGEDYAHRITFDYDNIEKITAFDPENQTSVGLLDSLLLYPMKEVVWTDELIERLQTAIEKRNENRPVFKTGCEKLLFDLATRREADGEELFYPLTFEKETGGPYTLLDYIPPEMCIIYGDYDRLDNAQESFDREYLGLYRKAETDVPEPQDILLPFRTLSHIHQSQILLRTIHGSEVTSAGRLRLDCDSPRSFFGNITYLKEELDVLIKASWRVVVYADSENQALRVREILKDFCTLPETADKKTPGKQAKTQLPSLIVLPLPLSAGFGLSEIKLLVIQENEIFGRRKQVPKSVKHAKSAVIDTFVELNPEDYVVHVNYGIGQFKGIERVRALGNERDYIKIEYADEETVFIPIEQVNLVQRYIGNEGNAPRLDKLGSKSWENRKNRVKKSVEDIAQRLIELYSKRRAARGYAFPKDTEWQTSFEAAFPYEETPDQITVIGEVKADMEKPVPMDRLVCGDVGYGKTEVAMRAAFKSVMGGKQVAFLAPTTILAEQHYDTCVERFGDFPVRIAQLSRFIAPAEQKKTLVRLKNGEVDVLIGTHRIIQKDVIFKDLGLLVIDEEQRFGVKDKERLKELKTSVDCLAMSATPIPRTLHMSLLKIRDMSLLTTPPNNRHPIETVIDAYNDDRVAAAIRREVERGGQVFFLHNRVDSLEETRLKLEKLVPEMIIDTAHGQMSATQLEDIFRRFKMGGFHVLVSTTIVENGIDIPNVNTIIIDRADMYGVSQLYQLRGRVGRSDRVAYAYLFYPGDRALSEIAMKRLQVISDFTDLGSGFKIAMKDMEIRGAGNLLGRDQSGDVYSVGFDLYLRLLEEAVQRLSGTNDGEDQETLLELEYTGFIPDSYIQNPQIKMEIYKKIASITSPEEASRVNNELEDRFGHIPDEVWSLLSLAEIRIICKKLAIASLKERNGRVTIEFARVSRVSAEKVIRLITESAGRVALNPTQPNIIYLQTGKIGLKEKSQFIREKLESLGK